MGSWKVLDFFVSERVGTLIIVAIAAVAAAPSHVVPTCHICMRHYTVVCVRDFVLLYRLRICRVTSRE